MKILYDNNLSTKQLPKSQTLLLNSHVSRSKLNIKLKTHSLTSLDIPLETFVDFNEISSSFRNVHQKTMAGSVDLISEIQQRNNENFSHLSSTKPLIAIVSSNEQQQSRQNFKHRFRMSNSFITPTSITDSVARLRRNGYLHNIRQSSLQTIDKITERKHRLLLTRNGSIPKFSFRDLPSNSRSSSTSVKQLEQSLQSRMSPFTSLPEIRSFVAHNCSDNLQTINDKFKLPSLSISPSWQKSDSWSWKSSNTIQNERIISNITTLNDQQHHNDDHSRFELPVIIESPLQQRSSLQTINQRYHHNSPTKLLNFRNDQIPQNSSRLYQKKNSFPHSISNYEVSQKRLSFQPTTRYPSTPLLAHSRQKNIDYQSYQLHMSPLASFDDDDDDDSDSISSHSSFRSCIDSINEFSDMNTTEISSILEESFQEISSSYNFHGEIFNETIKHSRSSIRHLCILQ